MGPSFARAYTEPALVELEQYTAMLWPLLLCSITNSATS
jgi:hypothetical protein